MTMPARARGFTLLEILIALVVLSVGLLGMAALMLLSVRTNHSAYLRTQATALAESMAGRMRANSRALWENPNPYSGDYPVTASAADCSLAAPCNFDAVAQRDRVLWSRELANFLPQARARIDCQRNSAGAVALTADIQRKRPPYDAACSLVIVWSESTLNKPLATTDPNASAPVEQTFAWVFQP